MQKKRHFDRLFFYRAVIAVVICAASIISGYLYIRFVAKHFPDHIYITEQTSATFDLSVPVVGNVKNTSSDTVDFRKSVTFKAGNPGNYSMDLRLFGVFYLNTIDINVVDEKYLYPCGFQAGLYLKSRGVLVVRTQQVEHENGDSSSPCENIILKGDYIVKINGKDINSKTELAQLVKESNGDKINLTLLRNGNTFDVKVEPVKSSSGDYQLGIWVKDDAQGVGTITYVDENFKFGALGHGITDSETGTILNIEDGKLYYTKILSIIKGKKGEPGELQGIIEYKDSNIIGQIDKNTEYGIYGKISPEVLAQYQPEAIEVGYRHNIHKGKAAVRLYYDNAFRDYEINITDINNGQNKNISFEVTSEELLDLTNGIVQGMSGCPIIQDGRIIGAVTHVLVEDSTSGYGIFIEKMLDK